MIRVNVAAVILQADQVLLVEFDDDSGLHYNLPGGGVGAGETLVEAVQREVWEEAGALVEVGRLLHVWEYVPARENQRYGTTHKVGLIFAATLRAGSVPHFTATPDAHQTGVCWKPLADLATLETVSFFGAHVLAALRQNGLY
jgi:8-oxo-dGTP pyrophosphatase MutT (NUDIX family)